MVGTETFKCYKEEGRLAEFLAEQERNGYEQRGHNDKEADN